MARGLKHKKTRYDAEHSVLIQAQEWDIADAPMSSERWQGKDALKRERLRIKEALERKSAELMMILARFTLVWYDDK